MTQGRDELPCFLAQEVLYLELLPTELLGAPLAVVTLPRSSEDSAYLDVHKDDRDGLFSDGELERLGTPLSIQVEEAAAARDWDRLREIAAEMDAELVGAKDPLNLLNAGLLSWIARNLGEDAVEGALEQAAPFVMGPAVDALSVLDAAGLIRQLALVWRAHGSTFHIEEHDDTFVIRGRPLGACGRLWAHSRPAERVSESRVRYETWGAYEPPASFHLMREPRGITYGRTGYPIYSCHCHAFHELYAIGRIGRPLWVEEHPLDDEDGETVHLVFKNFDAWPELYYERLGLAASPVDTGNRPRFGTSVPQRSTIGRVTRRRENPVRIDAAPGIRAAAQRHGSVVAVEDGNRSLTLGELVARAERFANALDGLGTLPGARVGILSENRAEYVVVDLGLALSGRVRVALNARLHLDDHRFVAADSGMSVLVYSAAFAEEAAALRGEGVVTISLDKDGHGGIDFDVLLAGASANAVTRAADPEDPAWITYTSGTTGRPKGVVLSRRSIANVSANLLREFGPVRPGELVVLPQPLSHGAGYFVLPWIVSGGGVYVMRAYDPDEVLAVGRRPNATIFKCVPAMLPPLLEATDGRPFGYSTIVYGASPIPRPVLAAALAQFGPILVQIYGQSEAPVTITCLRKADHIGDGDRRFSAGRPFARVKVEVRAPSGEVLPAGEPGEVAVTGPHLMTGYHGLPDATGDVLRDGWVMTRDAGAVDREGYLYLLGRTDEMIISGGYNIAPREVELVLSEFPGAEEVSVVGVPDERWGNAVTALVKMQHGRAATPDEVVSFARPRLGFRTPKVVAIVDAIPKNAYGKVDRAQLSAVAAAAASTMPTRAAP